MAKLRDFFSRLKDLTGPRRPPSRGEVIGRLIQEKIRTIGGSKTEFAERDYAYAIYRLFEEQGLPDLAEINQIQSWLNDRGIMAWKRPASQFVAAVAAMLRALDSSDAKVFSSCYFELASQNKLSCCPFTGAVLTFVTTRSRSRPCRNCWVK